MLEPTKQIPRLRALAAATFMFVVLSLGVSQPLASEPARASSPPNLGDIKQQITEYKSSGEYDHDVAAVLAKAQASHSARRWSANPQSFSTSMTLLSRTGPKFRRTSMVD